MKNLLGIIIGLGSLIACPASADSIEAEFATPPDSARPGVYWYFLDGNQDRAGMVADLHAMKRAGIGSVLFLEVDLGLPRGPVPFMCEAWQDNVAHSFVEAGKLGMEVVLGTGPGWAGSGGSWVGIADSMQHLVASSVNVSGPGTLDQVLATPPPHPANEFAGMTPAQAAEREKWFKDVSVLAFPTPPQEVAAIDEEKIKTLRDVQPYSIRRTTQRFVMPAAAFPEPGTQHVLDPTRVIDLTSRLQPDGHIRWEIPEGKWTVMRFVARGTGQTTRPAPRTGHGFECDKFDAGSFRRHWNQYQQKLLDRVVKEGGPLQPGRGVTTIHLDSWEMSSQNWTADFRQEFLKRRGYDPQPFYPAWMGMVVGSREMTERFLWDMRKTSQELVLDEHAKAIRQIAREHGLLYSNEPYDMNPAGDLDLGSLADIPMCEFWLNQVNTQYGCVEAVSVAHTMGRQTVKAEAFTSVGEAFSKTPANMKNQTDWALAMGINGIMFHTYVHQPLDLQGRPGMTLGPHGIHWNRNQTFWEYLRPYHDYIARSCHLLRQGVAVADILYLTPEGAPHIFEAPTDAFEGEAGIRDRKGHHFDAVSPRILAARATVQDGRIAFPGGTSYRVLVLPDVPTMTPGTLAKIDELVKAGATVIGNPPVKSPSLMNHPACDQEVATLAAKMWGGTRRPEVMKRIDRGKGAIYWGGDPKAGDDLYPTYATTAALLAGLGVSEDFTSPSGKLRFLHRRTAERDIYFVSNRTAERLVTLGVFRIEGATPHLWDPVTGRTRALRDVRPGKGVTAVPLSLEPFQSFFIVFARASGPVTPGPNFPPPEPVATIEGPWNVSFDPERGGPETITFDKLIDWTAHADEGVRYYSGTATYRKNFDLPSRGGESAARTWLDLGTVHDICRLRLNGKDLGIIWTAPWRVDITGAVHATGNRLEIEVANTWVNRLVGDQQPANRNVRKVSWASGLLGGAEHPAGRHSFVTHNDYTAQSPLQPAGLVGPVSILVDPHRSGEPAGF